LAVPEEDRAPPEIKKEINRLNSEEMQRHYRTLAMLEDLEGQMGRAVRRVRTEGIVVIEKDTAQSWLDRTTIDVFKYLYNDMKLRGRPYIKCVRITYRRVVVWVPNSTYTSGLTTNLMFVANPMTGEPNFFGRRIPAEVGALQVWRTNKFHIFSFNGQEGDKLFKDWKEFVTTDKASMTRLGIKKET